MIFENRKIRKRISMNDNTRGQVRLQYKSRLHFPGSHCKHLIRSFALADTAYQSLAKENRDQCILISGKNFLFALYHIYTINC